MDLTLHYKRYYSHDLQPELMPIEHVSFLTILGIGDLNGPVFADHVRALYAVAHGVRFLSKLRGKEFRMYKLEGSWSYDEKLYSGITLEEAPLKIPRNARRFALRIRMPDFVFEKEVSQALDVARLKKKVLPEQEILFEKIPRHQLVQVSPFGSFEKETAAFYSKEESPVEVYATGIRNIA